MTASGNVMSHVPSTGSLLDRVLRGLFVAGLQSDNQAVPRNWISFCEEGPFDFGPEEAALVDYCSKWYSSVGNSRGPDAVLAREYFESQDMVEVVDRLSEVLKAYCYAYENYRSQCQALKGAQAVSSTVLVLRDAARIAEFGFARQGQRVMRGPDDARAYVMEQLAAMPSAAKRWKTLAEARREREELKDLPRLPTGLPTLDAAFGGGIPPGHVHVVTAPPGNFKSTWVTRLAASWARLGHPVAILSNDEGGKTVDRLDAILAAEGLSPDARDKLPVWVISPESTIEEVAERLAKISTDRARAAALEQIRDERDRKDDKLIEYVVRTEKLWMAPVITLDSVQCARTARTDKLRDEYQRVSDVMVTCRAVAEKHRLVLVATSEANRAFFRSRSDSENSTGLTAGKGSSGIEYKADSPVTFRKVRDAEGRVLVRIKLEKNRLGEDEPEIHATIARGTFGFREVAAPSAMAEVAADVEIVAEIIKGAKPASMRDLYAACKNSGSIGRKSRMDMAVSTLKAQGRLRGGHGTPMEIVEMPRLEDVT